MYNKIAPNRLIETECAGNKIPNKIINTLKMNSLSFNYKTNTSFTKETPICVGIYFFTLFFSFAFRLFLEFGQQSMGDLTPRKNFRKTGENKVQARYKIVSYFTKFK